MVSRGREERGKCGGCDREREREWESICGKRTGKRVREREKDRGENESGIQNHYLEP